MYESCRKAMQKLKHDLINCSTCSHFRECKAEERKEEVEFDRYDRMMRKAVDIRME